jgi:tRNA threonylcarbamoyladenosine biosynthesis protein TsaE
MHFGKDTIILASAEATQALAEGWAEQCRRGDIIALYGPLGAGKTQLVKGLARGLKFSGDVTSPTFTLVHEYVGGRLPIYHLDLYRLEDVASAERMGIEDYLSGDGVTVIEWPEKVEELLSDETMRWEILMVSLTERAVRPVVIASDRPRRLSAKTKRLPFRIDLP